MTMTELDKVIFEAMYGREYEGDQADELKCIKVYNVTHAVQKYYDNLYDYLGEDQ